MNRRIPPPLPVSRRSQAAFTLIEVLIALTTVSILFTMVHGVLRSAGRVAERLEEEADLYRQARWVFYHLSRDVSMYYVIAQQNPPPAGGADPSPLFEGKDGINLGGQGASPGDSVRFRTLSQGLSSVAESDVVEVAYYLKNDLLVREVSRLRGGTSSDPLGEGLYGLSFRYLSPDGQSWVDQWNTTEEQKKAPLAVEVELLYKRNQAEPRRFKTIIEVPLGRTS